MSLLSFPHLTPPEAPEWPQWVSEHCIGWFRGWALTFKDPKAFQNVYAPSVGDIFRHKTFKFH